MGAAEDALSGLAAETKAFIILNEYRLGTCDALQLKSLLGVLAASDLERGSIFEAIRQKAEMLGIGRQQAESLVQALSGDAAAAAALRPPAPEAPVQTTQYRQSGAPPGPAPGVQSTFQVRTQGEPPQRRQTFRVARPPQKGRPQPKPPPQPPASGQPPQGPASAQPPQAGPQAAGDPSPFYGGDAGSIGNTQMLRRMAGRRVLLADDDARIRMVFRKRLEDENYMVEEATNGEQAWEKLQNEAFAAAVLDMKMPGLHGLELLARLTAAGSRVPVIICSAYEQLKDEFVVSTYPHLRYLVKPVAAEKLLEALRELVPQEA